MNRKSLLFLFHIPVWIVAIGFVFLIEYESGQFTKYLYFSISETIIVSAWFLGSFYLYFSFFVPKFLEKNKIVYFIMLSIVFLFSSPFLTNLTVTINRLAFNIPTPNRLTIWGYFGGIFGSFITGGFGTFYRFGIDWFKNLQVKKELENKNLQSELKILKSKLNPHLLFNTLNNIHTLIETSPEQASIALSKLSDLLRYVVYDTENEKVSIQKEIEILKKYIDLEKIRLTHPESVNFTCTVINEMVVPPMIFFPFVENAFKHSNLNNSGHKLTISISEEKNKLLFRCENTIGNKKENIAQSGLGLELARKRSDLLFLENYDLILGNVDNEFHVKLEITVE